MRNGLQLTGLVLSLTCMLLIGGCSVFDNVAAKLDKTEVTPAEKKKAALLKQIERKYENPQAHFELGQLYQADGLWTQADNHYNTALSFDPVHREAQAARIKVLLTSGDQTKSELLADIYMNQASSSAAASLRLALAFQRQGLDDYALGCYRQGLHLAPNSAKINRQIGYYYLSKGQKEQAKEYLSRSFQMDPGQAEVAGELGRLGVAIKIPRKVQKDTGGLDKIVEKTDQQIE